MKRLILSVVLTVGSIGSLLAPLPVGLGHGRGLAGVLSSPSNHPSVVLAGVISSPSGPTPAVWQPEPA
jgi:hypothetical protein